MTTMPMSWCGLVGVVLLHSGVYRVLRRLDAGKRIRVGEEVRAERVVEPLHPPVLVRRARRGQPMRDPVPTADLVEQHRPAFTEPVSELLADEFLTDVKLQWAS